MKKARWFPSVAVAFVTLYLSSIYGTISTISVLKQWNDLCNFTDHFQANEQPHDHSKTNIRNNTRAQSYTTSLTNSSKLEIAVGRNEEQLLHPIIAQTIRTHLSRLSFNATISNNDDHGNDILNDSEMLRRERFRVLEALKNHYSPTAHRLGSDVVELRHCRLDLVDYSRFSSWAAVILLDAWPRLEGKLRRNADELKGLKRDSWDDSMYLEFCLGLLEIFATHSSGEGNLLICDFEKYSLNPQRADLLSAESTLRSVPISSNGLPRLVFVIVAFQDVDHLEALIEACVMPHHLIIVHLERRSPTSFTDSVHRIASKHTNVVVVQFGSIIYQTDSVSTVNYQIMYWLTETLKIPYDYLLTLGNAAYPLYGAQELTNYFQKADRDIWLGELRNNMNGGWISWGYLERKRLIFTAGDQKYTQRTKKWKQNGFDSPIPEYIKTNMTEKTNSGNQAVFSYRVVKKLINSPQVRELFSLAKYGCCCCLEERTWIAAARIIGHGKEAMESASMFQVWGGEPVCGDGSMKNALLRPNATICYKSEDVTAGNIFERQHQSSEDSDNVENSYFRGDKLMDELRLAKERGFLFARKFKSGDQSSLELIEMIKTNIHNN